MKTPEEIADKHIYHYSNEAQKKAVYKAMQEYADQFKPSASLGEKPNFVKIGLSMPLVKNGISTSDQFTLTDIIEALSHELGEHYWNDYVLPLQSQLSELNERKEKDQDFQEVLEALRVVVDGYEGDGLEGMRIRDHVFYCACKKVLQKHESK